jgi:hypothetical protein
MVLKAPFPWFGGKSRVADIVWEHFGDVRNYVEPFFGSGAVLLGRPEPFEGAETVNDLDGLVSNFWRAIKNDAEAVASHADWPVNENDLHARHILLVNQLEDLHDRINGDPDFFDAKIAGWWVWGMCAWIGAGFCSGKGPWKSVDGKLIKSDQGQGINKKRIHLGNQGQGINKQLIHLGNQGQGILEWFIKLSERLRRVRVCSGDWSRVLGNSPTVELGLTGVFLDPPYSDDKRRADLYRIDSMSLSEKVREWCKTNGDNPKLRIALCGYDDEHDSLGWQHYDWKADGGYGNQGNGSGRENCSRERIWFSPHCL